MSLAQFSPFSSLSHSAPLYPLSFSHRRAEDSFSTNKYENIWLTFDHGIQENLAKLGTEFSGKEPSCMDRYYTDLDKRPEACHKHNFDAFDVFAAMDHVCRGLSSDHEVESWKCRCKYAGQKSYVNDVVAPCVKELCKSGKDQQLVDKMFEGIIGVIDKQCKSFLPAIEKHMKSEGDAKPSDGDNEKDEKDEKGGKDGKDEKNGKEGEDGKDEKDGKDEEGGKDEEDGKDTGDAKPGPDSDSDDKSDATKNPSSAAPSATPTPGAEDTHGEFHNPLIPHSPNVEDEKGPIVNPLIHEPLNVGEGHVASAAKVSNGGGLGWKLIVGIVGAVVVVVVG